MKKLTLLFSIVATSVAASILSSCGCCSGTVAAPALRPAPVFDSLSGPAPAPITYQK